MSAELAALARLAEIIEAQQCSECAAQNDHDRCDAPDVVAAIRQLMR